MQVHEIWDELASTSFSQPSVTGAYVHDREILEVAPLYVVCVTQTPGAWQSMILIDPLAEALYLKGRPQLESWELELSTFLVSVLQS
jgi:hypothetical protein